MQGRWIFCIFADGNTFRKTRTNHVLLIGGNRATAIAIRRPSYRLVWLYLFKYTNQKKMMMKTDFEDYKEMLYDFRRAITNEKEKVSEQAGRLMGLIKMADATDELLSENEKLKEENGRLNGENDRLRKEMEEKNMKLSELSKLSVGVAKKSSQDEVLKGLRTYINISKRKTLSKRVAVKMMIMELANAIDLSFPEDMVATLEALDDEQSEPKVLVQGDYVVSKQVANEVIGVAPGAVGINIENE